MDIAIPARHVPVLDSADVVICGGGPAGVAAAVSAARHGAEVILLERWPSVGGQATNALVNIWHTSDRVRPVTLGLVEETIERCGRDILRYDHYPKHPETHEFEPGAMRIVLHQMLEEAGVRVYCHLAGVESVVEDGRMKAVLVDAKRGRRAATGSLFIDATGDGDLAANAGVPFDFGRDEDGRVQGMTMMFRVCGLDPERVRAHPEEADRVFARMQELRAAGGFPPFMDLAANSYLHHPRPHTVSYNMCPVAGDPLDEMELTRLSALARRQVKRYVDFWRAEMPGFEAAEVEQTGFWLGIRESRRIRGRKTLDAAMVSGARKQPDAIGHGFWLIDIHDPRGTGYTTWSEQREDAMPPAGESYHIPLGMCLNDKIENLAVAGRCASATHKGQASVRVQTHCMVMGQGVGTAAAQALDENRPFARIDMPTLQAALRRDGVYLQDIPRAPEP